MTLIIDKHKYNPIERTEIGGRRKYLTPDGNAVASVTTILDATKDKTHLIAWRKRVGEQKAQEIVTEASGVGALGASLLALVRGRLSFSDLKIVIRKTTQTTAYIFALFVGATMFALILRGLGGDELIEGALKALPFGTSGVVIVVLFVAFLLGFFLDWIEITLIILPFLAPVMMDLGVDMVWFIVMFAVVLQTSFITPPVGFALFYMKGVAPQGITIINIYKGIIPFVILQVIAVTIVFNFPEIVTWLPKAAYGP